MSDTPHFDVYVGHASSIEARFYVRLRDKEQAVPLAGSVEGPFSEYAHTLPATFPLRNVGPTEAPLAEAIVPDPCFWTPDAPFTYRVSVGIAGQTATRHTLAGIRPLTADGPHLYWSRRRCVLRGLSLREAQIGSLDPWHRSGATLLVSSPSDELCGAASRFGVLLVAQLSSDPTLRQAEIARLQRWPAVGLCVIAADNDSVASWQELPPQVLRGEYFPPGRDVVPRTETQVVLCEDAHPESLVQRISDVSIPTIAVASSTFEPAEWPQPQAESWRSACDQLQRLLAPEADLAGYLIRTDVN